MGRVEGGEGQKEGKVRRRGRLEEGEGQKQGNGRRRGSVDGKGSRDGKCLQREEAGGRGVYFSVSPSPPKKNISAIKGLGGKKKIDRRKEEIKGESGKRVANTDKKRKNKELVSYLQVCFHTENYSKPFRGMEMIFPSQGRGRGKTEGKRGKGGKR